MDIASYKQSVKSYSDDLLISQHQTILELRENCWDNAQDSSGNELEHWLNEYNEANEQLKVLVTMYKTKHKKTLKGELRKVRLTRDLRT